MDIIENIRSSNCGRPEVLELCDAFEKLRDGICLGMIPGTFIMCGEGDNFCSSWCELYKTSGGII